VIHEVKSRWRGIRPVERHSIVLGVAGFVYIAIGYTYFTVGPSPARAEALKYALNVIDYDMWGIVWMTCGVLSIISARWPPISETWGYLVLTGQSAAWALFYLVGIVFADAPVAGMSSVCAWGLVAFLWWAISGLINPNALRKLWARLDALHEENLALHAELRRLRDGEG
jgi:hypothetical protein